MDAAENSGRGSGSRGDMDEYNDDAVRTAAAIREQTLS
jgi:hypothetical protein